MQQFSFYQTLDGLLEKTVCLLTEKCYSNKLRLVIMARNIDLQEQINQLLWTYSQKQFIPHGSKLDQLPAKQPVYITSEIENPNNATVIILVNPATNNITNFIAHYLASSPRDQAKIPALYDREFQRIIVIYDESDKEAFKQINQIINQLQSKKASVEYYIQNSNGTWLAK